MQRLAAAAGVLLLQKCSHTWDAALRVKLEVRNGEESWEMRIWVRTFSPLWGPREYEGRLKLRSTRIGLGYVGSSPDESLQPLHVSCFPCFSSGLKCKTLVTKSPEQSDTILRYWDGFHHVSYSFCLFLLGSIVLIYHVCSSDQFAPSSLPPAAGSRPDNKSTYTKPLGSWHVAQKIRWLVLQPAP